MWYHLVKKVKYGEKTNLSYTDTYTFIIHIKTDDNFKDIAEDVDTRFIDSSYELDRPLPKGKILD